MANRPFAMIALGMLIATGCSRDEPRTTDEDHTVEAATEATSEAGAVPAKEVEATVEKPLKEAAPASSTREPAAPATAAAHRPPTRDLAAELREAVGNPEKCLTDYQPSSAMTIRVVVNAIVRPSGLIIDPSASGPGLSANDRRCIEDLVSAVVLEPLPEDGSQPVSTVLEIRYEPATVKEYDVAPPPPAPENVIQPLPKKKPIPPSGQPIEGPAADPIEGPSGVPIEGPQGVPIEGPKPVPIEGD